MKKAIKILLIASSFLAFSANAKEEIIELKDNSLILGSWQMNAETAALHKEKKEVKNIWEFRNDGFLAATSFDRRLDSANTVKVKYSVEDGVIKKQQQPGREKYESCKVITLDKKEMLLHCKYLYYFFTKK